MPGPPRRGIQLPKQLLEQLDITVTAPKQAGAGHVTPRNRKAQRKAGRVEKRASHTRPRKVAKNQDFYHHSSGQDHVKATNKHPKQTSPHSSPEFSDANSDISVNDAGELQADVAHVEAPKVGQQEKHSGKVKRKLDEDDAKIVALEKKLGIKSERRLPKSFADDGLLDILESIDGNRASIGTGGGAIDDGQQWLASKRQRALQEDPETLESESEFSGFDESEDDRPSQSSHKIGSIYRAASESDNAQHASSKTPARLTRRATSPSARLVEGEAAQGLRRIVRGIFNRLSEPNLLSLLSEIESLFQGNPRQLVFTIFLDNVLDQIGGPDVLSETFLILNAGFIAAVYKTVGSDFGAEAIQRICESLERDLDSRDTDSQSEKKAVNLITTLTHLFTLQVISSELVYDFIRKFVGTISESNTQLLLRIVKSSGTQLRQEDPSSLKEIVMHLQSAIARINPDEISVRTKFTIEMITDLKNNKMKTGLSASSIALEHLTRMKRLLASIGQHRVKAAEPLHISLTDLHDVTKSGHWWLAGAKHRTMGVDVEYPFVDSNPEKQSVDRLEDTRDIQRLASEQRMNTDVRRSIFVNLMSASDCQDAYQRLIGLRLRRPQEPEIAKVLLHCATSEERYNPYYTLVADLLCSSRRMKISFQIALWEALNRLESAAFEIEIDHEVSETSELRPAVHLAKMFAELVTEQKLDIKLIKNMRVESAHGPVHAFLEVFFLSICLRARRRKGRSAFEQSLLDIFRPLTDDAAKAHSVRAFFEGTLRNSDMVATTIERERLSQCCDIVESILQEQAT